MMKNKLTPIMVIMLLSLSSCVISPGMHMDSNDWLGEGIETVYIKEIDKTIVVKDISQVNKKNELDISYKIGNGDLVYIRVWGIESIFPSSSGNRDQNTRRVDSNGNIFFPYVGELKAAGKTTSELRKELTQKLSIFFNEPQLDITISEFNSQKIYILGEVLKPSKVNLTDVPITLTDALGNVLGLNNNTSSASNIFIIRNPNSSEDPIIYKADLGSPSNFLIANNFYLQNNDVIYVNANGTTRWNRVISQFFPFSAFLNSVDNLSRD